MWTSVNTLKVSLLTTGKQKLIKSTYRRNLRVHGAVEVECNNLESSAKARVGLRLKAGQKATIEDVGLDSICNRVQGDQLVQKIANQEYC